MKAEHHVEENRYNAHDDRKIVYAFIIAVQIFCIEYDGNHREAVQLESAVPTAAYCCKNKVRPQFRHEQQKIELGEILSDKKKAKKIYEYAGDIHICHYRNVEVREDDEEGNVNYEHDDVHKKSYLDEFTVFLEFLHNYILYKLSYF